MLMAKEKRGAIHSSVEVFMMEEENMQCYFFVAVKITQWKSTTSKSKEH